MNSSGTQKVNVLFVGQIPPPYGGQAIMQKVMLDGNYDKIKFHHVRMNFSREMDEVGKFGFRKVLHLFQVIFNIFIICFRYNISILYYPPAGPNRIPMIRDFAILLATRWLFKKTIFHFRAGGISEIYQNITLIEKFFFRLAYYNADLGIRLSDISPEDGKALHAKNQIIIPNGIADQYSSYFKKKDNEIPVILFVGVIRESKGVMFFLEACLRLKQTGCRFAAKIMGHFESSEFEQKVYSFIEQYDLGDRIEFLGVLTGEKKWQTYSNADIFCLPSFFESESVAVVVLEAMQFELPVVSTWWRGIPSAVEDQKSGYLVEIRNSKAVAEKLHELIINEKLRRDLGKCGREIFLKKFSLERFYKQIEEAIITVADQENKNHR